MTFNLTNFYVQTGATRSDILPSVVSFEAHVGVVPDPGSMTAKMVYPTLDTAGSAVTIAKGMTIWMYYYQATPTLDDCVPFAGVITNVEQTGEYIIVTAESLLAPIMRGTFTADYSSAEYVYEIFNDALAAFTPVEPYLISGSYTVYRAATGGAQVPNDVQLDDISFTGETLLQIAQYFSEILINTGLTSNLSTVYPTYYTDPGTGKASVYLTYTGYGNHALTAVEIDHDAGILSSVDWADATDTIINDVTVTIKGGAEYQKTDAASIAAYGQRETKLFRPMYYTNTTYAQKHADTMVAALKSPMSRCFATIEQDFVLAWGSVNGVYTVTDAISGKSEEMVLRSFTLRYPNSVCDCDFDNAALNLANYGIRLENRVSNLESNLVTAHSGFYDLQGGQAGQYYHLNATEHGHLSGQDQPVKTGSSPTFAGGTINGNLAVTGNVDGVDVSAHAAEVTTKHLPSQASQAGKFLKTDGSVAAWDSVPTPDVAFNPLFNTVASATVRSSSDGVVSYTWASTYSLKKTITMVNGLGTGTYRVYFELAAVGASGVARGMIYKNGVPIGTARTKTGTAYAGFSEDFAGPLATRDTIELWCYQNGGDGSGGYCRNFRILYDPISPLTSPTDAVDSTTPIMGPVTATDVRTENLTQTVISADASAPNHLSLPGIISYFNNTGAYAVFRTYRLKTGLNGTVRFRWSVKSQGMYSDSYMTINGFMIGSIINTGGTLWANHDDTVAVCLHPGDVIEFWGTTSNGFNQEFRDFYISYYTEAATSEILSQSTGASPVGYLRGLNVGTIYNRVAFPAMMLFTAYSTATTSVDSTGITVPYSTVTAPYFNNVGTALSGGIFTTPVAGYYLFNWTVSLAASSSATELRAVLYINGVGIQQVSNLKPSTASAQRLSVSGSCVLYLGAGIPVKVTAYSSTAINLSGSDAGNVFSATLVSA